MIAHHTCHRGYDWCHPDKNRWNRFKFAIGNLWTRTCDWFDWMIPEAWNVEHNNRHHYSLSEIEDPDLVENNLTGLRLLPIPRVIKLMIMPIMASIWKWFYYAPNTYKELKLVRWRQAGTKIPKGVITSKHAPSAPFSSRVEHPFTPSGNSSPCHGSLSLYSLLPLPGSPIGPW